MCAKEHLHSLFPCYVNNACSDLVERDRQKFLPSRILSWSCLPSEEAFLCKTFTVFLLSFSISCPLLHLLVDSWQGDQEKLRAFPVSSFKVLPNYPWANRTLFLLFSYLVISAFFVTQGRTWLFPQDCLFLWVCLCLHYLILYWFLCHCVFPSIFSNNSSLRTVLPLSFGFILALLVNGLVLLHFILNDLFSL